MPNEIHPLFNETHPYKYLVNENTPLESLLTFVRSVNIQAFPCGRRTSAAESAQQNYYFPFDPEARLNTEANNRKHSSLNGYTQTYLKDWDSDRKLLTLSLAGYLFTIALDGTYTKIENGKDVDSTFDYSNIAEFCSAVTTQLNEKANSILSSARSATINTEEKVAAAEELLRSIESSDYIYANILLEDVHLFSGAPKEYFTSILRDQYDTTNSELAATNIGPNPLLDMLNKAAEDAADFEPKLKPDNYFFSGLSFSATPLTGVEATRSSALHTVAREHMPDDTTTQLVVSLRILEKVDDEWQINQPAYLPKIEHGVTEDSIVVTGESLFKELITAEKGIKVGNDLYVEGNLTVDQHTETNTLKVLDRTTTDYLTVTNKATITEIDATSTYTDELTTPNATITDATITKATITSELYVHNPGYSEEDPETYAKAKIDAAEIGIAVITGADVETAAIADTDITTARITTATITDATVTTAGITTANIDNATIGTAGIDDTTTNTLQVTTKATINEADVEIADIKTLTGEDATIDDIVGTNTVSSANMYQNGYKVPIIELNQSGNFWQLKISRTGKKS